jgi:thiamine pyrophosphate-dependent acetolactate synthase large subunit-like protein
MASAGEGRMSATVADCVFKRLGERGVTRIFGYPATACAGCASTIPSSSMRRGIWRSPRIAPWYWRW